MGEKIALKIRDVSFSYKNCKEEIVKNLSMDIFYGKILLFCGVSSSGKTTLLNIINGVLPHTREGELHGDIFYEEKSILKESVQERARIIGTIFQNPREQIIFDRVKEELLFPMENLLFSKEKMEKTLEHILEHVCLDVEARTATLSGGEKQKLVLGAVLGMGQKILLLDEPFANLDNSFSMGLLRKLRYLAEEEKYAIVLVEHRLDLVLSYVDKVACFEKEGKVTYYKDANAFATELESKDNLVKKVGIGALDIDDGNILPSSKRKSIFTLENVGVEIKGKKIFSGMDLQVFENDRLVILGENGKGKSTLLNVLSFQQKHTQGNFQCSIEKKLRNKKIGMVLQNPDYQLFMPTVKEELELTCEDELLKEEIIRRFSFENLLKRSPFCLSEGQKRKLGFACVLLRKPEVLIMDEPTVGLDTESLQQMLDVLEDYQKENTLTMISVSHDKRALHLLGKRFINM